MVDSFGSQPLRGFRLSTQDRVSGKLLENSFYHSKKAVQIRNLSIFVLSPIINDCGNDVVLRLHFVILVVSTIRDICGKAAVLVLPICNLVEYLMKI